MTFFTTRKNSTNALSKDGSTQETLSPKSQAMKSMRGNIFFALFAAVAMVGAVGYGFNTVIRGPITGMSDVTRRTVTENFVITSARIAIVNATTQQDNAGDCDDDGMIEPLPFRAAGGAPAPIGGGLLPTDLVPDTIDPWNSEYGYCAWDAGSLSVSDAVAGCGGGGANRLEGSPLNNQYAIAIISAGKDKKFDTRCNAYVDTTPADNLPDTPLLVKTAGSDDIVLAYTYAEANNLGNGLWKEKVADPTTLQTDKNVESTGGATFADAVVLTGNTITGGGLVLPGDPGDDTLSGPCNGANERQLRRNTSTTPPTMEICDYNGGTGLGWVAVSGSGAPGGGGSPADCTGLGDEFYNDPMTGHCYFIDNAGSAGGATAEALCTSTDPSAYLALISSSVENDILDTNGWYWAWISGSDNASEGNWVYTTGELAGQQFWTGGLGGSTVGGLYSNWDAGDPNNDFGDSDCVLIVNDGAWHVHGCTQTQPVICEMSGTPAVPTGPADCSGLGDEHYNDATTGHCYYRDDHAVPLSFSESQSECGSNGGYLAVISSLAESTLVFNNLITGDGINYIGGRASVVGSTGDWKWLGGELNGQVFSTGSVAQNGLYTNWAGGEPNDGAESCLQMGWDPGGAWDDHTCSADGGRNGHVCEITGTTSGGGGGGGGGGAADCTGLGDQSYNDPSTGHCYFYESTNTFTQAAAQAACAAEGAYLAVPSSSAENDLIYNTFPQDGPYIGLGDAAVDGEWRYLYGELADTQFWSGNGAGSVVGGNYANWDTPTDPNGTTSENCAVFNWNGANNWISVNCTSYTSSYVCEKTGTAPGNPPPVSRWRLDESAGATASDSMGNHNGAISGSTTWQSTGGVHNGGLQFNGTGRVLVTRTPALETPAITVSAWIKRNGAQTWYSSILSKAWQANASPPYHSYALQFDADSDDTLSFVTGHGSGVDNLYSSAAIIPDNTWVHIAGTYDPSGPAPQKKFYINGVLDNSSTLTDPLVYDTSTDGDLVIGDSEGSGDFFVGTLDDVRFYNKALTAAQIQTIYEATSPPPMQLRSQNRAGKLFSWGSSDTNEQLGNGVGTLTTTAPYAVVNGDDFIQASASGTHGCGVKSDGTVWCWGADGSGQLGNGPTTGSQGVMTQATGITNATKVSTTLHHSCALLNNGQIMCWGFNNQGQLGTGNVASSPIPVRATTYEDFIDVATTVYAVTSTTCGLRSSGAVLCWGEGSGGELGNGASVDSVTPVQVSNVTDFVKITGSSSNNTVGGHFCGITKSGAAYCWGSEKGAEFGNGAAGGGNVPSQIRDTAGTGYWTDWADIATKATVTCGVRANGLGYCWGTETSGNLGNGVTSAAQATPVPIDSNITFKKIEPGTQSSCGITTKNALYCWGTNSSGQLGTPSLLTSTYTSPVAVNGRNVVDLSMSSTNFLIIMDEEATDAVAANKMPNLLSVGNAYGCSIIRDGAGVCWGDDTAGELGNGAITGNQTIPTAISDAGPWMQIVVNPVNVWGHTCGIKGDGTAWCWGTGTDGQMGNGANSSQPSPVPVSGASYRWSQLTLGEGYVCGLEVGGDLYCWGNSLGNVPVLRNFGIKWNKISSGVDSSCGIDQAGEAWCWGNDTSGQLGNGSTLTAAQTTPSAVASAGPWVDIAAGRITCGIKANGSLWCWGDLSAASITGWDNTSPQLMMDTGPWVKVETNYQNVCAIKADGSLWCLGEGGTYMNGNGVTTDFSYPQLVLGGGKYIDVSVGSDTACGLRSDYSIYCWGGSLQRPTRKEIVTSRAGWEWDATDMALKPAPGLSPMIGTSRWISDDGAANKGLNMGTTGRSQLRQSVANQLLVESKGPGLDAQATLRAVSAVAGDVQDGLIRHFKLDETTGSAIVDAQGVGNGTWTDGTGNSVAEEDMPGINGSSIKFDGSNDRISVPDHASLDVGAQVTLAAWVRPNVIGSGFYGMAHRARGATAEDIYGLLISDSGTGSKYVFVLTTTSGFAAPSSIASAPSMLGQWVHLVGTYDGSSAKLYLNGVLQESESLTGDLIADSTVFTIGAAYQNGSLAEYFNGYVDDVRLYNRALDPGEIQQLYHFTQTSVITRSMGVDAATGNFEIARNNSTATAWLSYINPDIEISKSGNVGIGTTGAPASKLDVNGAIRVGNEITCDAGAEGTIRWTGTEMQYCDGTWQPLVSTNTGGGGGGGATTGAWQSSNDLGTGCWIKNDGTAWCWGYAYGGRLGNNQDSVVAPSPVAVHSNSSDTGWTDWIHISSNYNSCGLRANGTAWCWGINELEELGIGASGSRTRPTQVVNSAGSGTWSDWTDIVSNNTNGCGLRATGEVYCWGYQMVGAVGNNNTDPWGTNTPTLVHSDSSSTGWTDWVQIDHSGNHGCGIRANGSIWCWGWNLYGEVGDSSTTLRSRPRQTRDNSGGATYWYDWKKVSVGGFTTCGIRANGTAWCWGNGSSGQLGNDSWIDEPLPERVVNEACSGFWSDWIDIDVGDYGHVCGIRANGTAWCWGRNDEGQAGNGSTGGNIYCADPVLASDGGPGWSDWTSISADYTYTCGARANGTVWCWGDRDADGRLGDGVMGGVSNLPVQVGAP